MTIYMLCDEDGFALTDGLQAHEARRIAQQMANRRRESVWLSESGSEDEGDEIEPQQTIRHFCVDADRETGLWHSHTLAEQDPVEGAEFFALCDTEAFHYDTFEHQGETCAVSVTWKE